MPSFILGVEFPSERTVSLGNTLKVRHTQDEPSYSVTRPSGLLDQASSDLSYTITATDPDAPSRDNPEWAEFCHLIATGLHLSSSSSSSVGSGPSVSSSSGLEVIMPWKSPGPPPGTGKHRYVFLLFAPENGTTDRLHLTTPKERKHWGTGKERHGVRDWALSNGLVPVGKSFPSRPGTRREENQHLKSALSRYSNQITAANFFYAQNEEQ